MTVRLAAHWALYGIAALVTVLLVPLPFATSWWSGAAGVLTAAGVLLHGHATTPNPRKGGRR